MQIFVVVIGTVKKSTISTISRKYFLTVQEKRKNNIHQTIKKVHRNFSSMGAIFSAWFERVEATNGMFWRSHFFVGHDHPLFHVYKALNWATVQYGKERGSFLLPNISFL
jgi:hypothetical protein